MESKKSGKVTSMYESRGGLSVAECESSYGTTNECSAVLSKNMLLAEICRDKTMYIDHKVFFEAVQEVAIPLNGARANKEHYRPNGVNGQYKLIWNCAQLLFDKLFAKTEYFKILEMNRSCYRKKICDWIYHNSRRNLMKRSDLTEESHPHVWEYVKDLNPSATIYYLDQAYVFEKAVSLWGITDNGYRTVLGCDLCRLIGVMLSEKCCNALTGAQQRTIVVDSVEDTFEDQNRYHFDDVAKDFNDVKNFVAHPEEWNLECTDLVGYNDIDPNDFGRIKLSRRRDELKSLWMQVYAEYKSAMYAWKNGPGMTVVGNENVEKDGEGEDRGFDQVARAQQANKYVPYLMWVYLADKKAGFVLYSIYENKPVIEAGVVSNLYHAKYNRGGINKLRCNHSAIIKDLAVSRNMLEEAKILYKQQKKKRRVIGTKIGEVQLAKEAVKVYMVNVDLLNIQLAQSIGTKMMKAVEDFDVSSDSDSSSR